MDSEIPHARLRTLIFKLFYMFNLYHRLLMGSSPSTAIAFILYAFDFHHKLAELHLNQSSDTAIKRLKQLNYIADARKR